MNNYFQAKTGPSQTQYTGQQFCNSGLGKFGGKFGKFAEEGESAGGEKRVNLQLQEERQSCSSCRVRGWRQPPPLLKASAPSDHLTNSIYAYKISNIAFQCYLHLCYCYFLLYRNRYIENFLYQQVSTKSGSKKVSESVLEKIWYQTSLGIGL